MKKNIPKDTDIPPCFPSPLDIPIIPTMIKVEVNTVEHLYIASLSWILLSNKLRQGWNCWNPKKSSIYKS